MTAKVKDFRKELSDLLRKAENMGFSAVEIKAGNLHRRIGGYPGRGHRMPVCCDVMCKIMKGKDAIISEPISGLGASLKIRYYLPRK